MRAGVGGSALELGRNCVPSSGYRRSHPIPDAKRLQVQGEQLPNLITGALR